MPNFLFRKLPRTALAAAALGSATVTAATAATIFSPTAAPFVNGSATNEVGLVLPGFGPVTQYGENVTVVSDSFNLLTSVETVVINYDNFAQFAQNGVPGYSLLPSTATFAFAGRTGMNQTGTFAETLLSATTSGADSFGNTIAAQLDPAQLAADVGSVTITPTTGGYDITNSFVFNDEVSTNGGPFVILPTETGTSAPIGFVAPVPSVPVPEPASLALLGVFLAGLGLIRRRRAYCPEPEVRMCV